MAILVSELCVQHISINYQKFHPCRFPFARTIQLVERDVDPAFNFRHSRARSFNEWPELIGAWVSGHVGLIEG